MNLALKYIELFIKYLIICLFLQLSDIKDGINQATPTFGFGSRQTATFGSPGKRYSNAGLHWFRKIRFYRFEVIKPEGMLSTIEDPMAQALKVYFFKTLIVREAAPLRAFLSLV